MHTLSDSEFRLLCAVARATLGPAPSPGARPSLGSSNSSLGHPQQRGLCASLAQLQALTGRNASTLSGAIGSLVAEGLLEVSDAKGQRLPDASARRAGGTSLVYRLSARCFETPDTPSLKETFANDQSQKTKGVPPLSGVPPRKGESSPEVVTSPEKKEEKSLSSREDSPKESSLEKKDPKKGENTVSFFPMGQVKPSSNPVSQRREPRGEVSVETQPPDEVEFEVAIVAQAQAFEALFAAQWRSRFPQDVMTTVSQSDRRALCALLVRWPRVAPRSTPLEKVLPLFFETRHEPAYGFIARHDYSLDAFVHSVFVLLFGHRRLS